MDGEINGPIWTLGSCFQRIFRIITDRKGNLLRFIMIASSLCRMAGSPQGYSWSCLLPQHPVTVSIALAPPIMMSYLRLLSPLFGFKLLEMGEQGLPPTHRLDHHFLLCVVGAQ